MGVSIGTIIKGIQVWRAVKPFKRWKARRAAKELTSEQIEIEVTEESGMNEQIASVIRSVLKSLGGGLVGAGVLTSGELEVLAGAVAILVGMGWSWWAKRNAD